MSFPINNLKNVAVRELAWCIAAPGLLQSLDKNSRAILPSNNYFEELAEESANWISELDNEPEVILDVLGPEQKLILGKRFERLLHVFFEKSPRFELLHHGIQLKEDDLTIGELDFVVRDLTEDKVIHIETACKFYLSAVNQSDPFTFPGINPKDTLGHKCAKLKNQISLTETPVGKRWCRENNLMIDEKQIWLKGYFFHHYRDIGKQKAPKNANPNYASGWWLRQSEAADFFRRSRGTWAILPKESWLAPAIFRTNESGLLNSERVAMLLHTWPDHYAKSLMIAMLQPGADGDAWYEVNRGVVVPDRWPGVY